MDYSAVFPASENLADFLEGEVGEVSAEVHGDLPGDGNFAGAAGAGEVGDFQMETFCDEVLDFARVEGVFFLFFFVEDVAEDLLCQGEVDWLVPLELLEVAEAVEGTFEAADVGLEGGGKEFRDFGADVEL